MFDYPNHLYDTEELKAHASGKLNIARLIQGCVKSEAWKMFLALARLKEIEILRKADYQTLEDFRADRAGLRFLRETIDEFVSYKNEAEEAIKMLNQLNEAEKQTPLDLGAEMTAREEA